MLLPLRAFTVIAPLLIAGAAMAQSNERCSGTLCDLYYGGAPAASQPQPAAKAAAPTPIMVPQGGILGFFSKSGSSNTAPSDANGTPASSTTSRVHVGGGGLLGLARGEAPERCSGTICDLYYGGPPPEKPAPAAAAAPAQATAGTAAEAPADAPDEAPRASRRRSRVEFVETEAKPSCAPSPQDPWRCYRK